MQATDLAQEARGHGRDGVDAQGRRAHGAHHLEGHAQQALIGATAQEHAEHGAIAAAVERDQLPFNDMILEPTIRHEFDDALERLDRIAFGAEIERDQVGLAVRQHRDRRRRTAKMAARI